HAASEHMAVVAISGDDLVPGLDCHLHAEDDRLLPDVKVAEAADQAHAVELPGLFFESSDEEHLAISVKLLLAVEIRRLRRRFDGRPAHRGGLSRWFVGGNGHFSPRVGLDVCEAAGSPIAEIAARRKRRGAARTRLFAPANRYGKPVALIPRLLRSGLLEAQRELARIGGVEQHPGTLIQHGGIDALGL